ncbi:MAG: hypothetical protein JWN95_2067 [Frankiales bacterium]|nr:hypothetical protein [Frankiales bacterium]
MWRLPASAGVVVTEVLNCLERSCRFGARPNLTRRPVSPCRCRQKSRRCAVMAWEWPVRQDPGRQCSRNPVQRIRTPTDRAVETYSDARHYVNDPLQRCVSRFSEPVADPRLRRGPSRFARAGNRNPVRGRTAVPRSQPQPRNHGRTSDHASRLERPTIRSNADSVVASPASDRLVRRAQHVGNVHQHSRSLAGLFKISTER